MNILFISLGSIRSLEGSSVHLDVLKRLAQDHNVYVVCKRERRDGKHRPIEISVEQGVTVMRVRTGNVTKVGLLEKGIATLLIERQFKRAIEKYYDDVVFDLVLYTTPPTGFVNAIKYVKERDHAKTYLMLKDVFPQNAVDLGVLSTKGLRGVIYRRFRRQEKELYRLSDHIGCMSPANCEYVLRHNPEIAPERVELCPNVTVIEDVSVDVATRKAIRQKYGVPVDARVFVYGGNLGRPQNVPFVIECIKRQNEPRAFFLVVGAGTEYARLSRFANEDAPGNFKLLSYLPKKDYETLVAACDVGMIFLDHRFTIPNFPSRLLSYMKAKTPVLAVVDPNTDVGTTVVQGGFGWSCNSSNADEFANIVRKIVEITDDEINAMKEREFRFLQENYNPDVAYNAIMQHF